MEFKAAPVGGFVVEGRMGDGFVEAGFEFGKEGATAVIVEAIGTAQFFLELLALQDAVVKDGNDDGVDDERTKFFHEIERQGRLTILAGV